MLVPSTLQSRGVLEGPPSHPWFRKFARRTHRIQNSLDGHGDGLSQRRVETEVSNENGSVGQSPGETRHELPLSCPMETCGRYPVLQKQ